MKMELRLVKKHFQKRMRIGRHEVTPVPQVFDLNKDEIAKLNRPGVSAWIQAKKPAKPAETKAD